MIVIYLGIIILIIYNIVFHYYNNKNEVTFDRSIIPSNLVSGVCTDCQYIKGMDCEPTQEQIARSGGCNIKNNLCLGEWGETYIDCLQTVYPICSDKMFKSIRERGCYNDDPSFLGRISNTVSCDECIPTEQQANGIFPKNVVPECSYCEYMVLKNDDCYNENDPPETVAQKCGCLPNENVEQEECGTTQPEFDYSGLDPCMDNVIWESGCLDYIDLSQNKKYNIAMSCRCEPSEEQLNNIS